MVFADRLKQLRKEFNLTQKELAEKINKAYPTVAGYEASGKEPNYETLKTIAKLFNVSVDWLIGNTDNRMPIDEMAKAISTDSELLDILDKIRRQSELRSLFEIAKTLSKEEIERVIRIIRAIRDEPSDTAKEKWQVVK